MNADSFRMRVLLSIASVFPMLILGALPAAAAIDPGCAVTLEPSTVTVSHETIRVTAIPSESIGSLVGADIDEHSDIDIEVVETERHDDGSFGLEFDLGAAEPGTWSLTLHGLHGDCAGEIEVEDDLAR